MVNRFGLYGALFKRELALHAARKSELFGVLLFYVIFVSLFPITIGPMPVSIMWIAPIIIWIAVLVTTAIAQQAGIRDDHLLGIYEQMHLSRRSLPGLMLSKIFAHWLVLGLPMIMLTPILALSLSLPILSVVIVTCSLLLGTLTLSLLGALGAALTVSLANGGMLLAILILPLYVPMLVLGCNIGSLSLQNVISWGHLALLLALLLTSLLCVPWAVAAAIKVSMEQA